MAHPLPIAISESLREEVGAVLAAAGQSIEAVEASAGHAFLHICQFSEIETVRQHDVFSDSLVLVLILDELERASAIAEGAERTVFRGDEKSLLQTLAECGNTWKRSLALRHRQLATDAILDHMSESVEITAPDVKIEYVNPAFERRTGYLAREAIGKSPAELMRSSGHSKKLYESMEATCRRGCVWQGELLTQGRNGEDDYVLATIIPVLDHTGLLVKMASLKHSLRVNSGENDGVEGVDGGRLALLRLSKSEERYRKLVDAADDCLIVSDFESGQVLSANQATIDRFGYSLAELRQRTTRMLSPQSEQKKIDAISEKISDLGWAQVSRVRMSRNDGSEFWATGRYRVFSTHGQTCYLTVIRDISDELRKEAQLQEANEKVVHNARLAAIGRLSAGFAHEINNPATVVKLNLEYLQELLNGEVDDVVVEEERDEAISDALIGIDRIQGVTRQLLGFSRSPGNDREEVCLRKLIELAVRFVRAEIDYRAELILDLGEVPALWMEEARISQLFVNLLVNAVHAIDAGNKKHNSIRVKLKCSGDNVVIHVTDTGCGMSEELQQRVFDPFFSTKKAGSGTGLGLSLCRDTVVVHGGTLVIDSQEGVGTTVLVNFPVAKNSCPARLHEDSGKVESFGIGRILRVLLIDDDTHVLSAYQRSLSTSWTIIVAEGGELALEILKSDREFDLILCDIMMPTVDGAQVYKTILRTDPKLAEIFVFCTAGAFTEQNRQFLQNCGVPILRKPVSQSDLLASFALIQSPADKRTNTSNDT